MAASLQTTSKIKSSKDKLKTNSKNEENDEMQINLHQIPVTANVNEQILEHYEQTSQQQLDKIQTLQYALGTDLLACDAKWTLFVAAALSYRYDFVLKPFPPQFSCEQYGYNIDSLIMVIHETPKLKVILQNLIEQNSNDLSSNVIDLLYWVLIELREPALRHVEGEELYTILTSIDDKCLKLKPTHAFEINALTGYHSNVAFRDRTSKFPLKLAFMGCKFDNIFSLLQNGFTQSSEVKTALQLTTDLQTCLYHSPNCAAWGASQCGSIIACTAICEFALNTDTDQISENKRNKSCVDVIVNNPENIRIRYLLFYGQRFPRKSKYPKNRFWSWIINHKYSLSLFSYMIFLISIAVANSGNGETFRYYVSKKINLILDFWRRMITKESVQ
ncbi:poly(ADP-ribose) polymerase 16 [Cochliomyia hominivorax]